jgi:hypothetical protein
MGFAPPRRLYGLLTMPTEGRDAIPGTTGCCIAGCIDSRGVVDCRGLLYIGNVEPTGLVGGPLIVTPCVPDRLYAGTPLILWVLLLLLTLLGTPWFTTAILLGRGVEANGAVGMPVLAVVACDGIADVWATVLAALASTREEALSAFAKIGKYAAAGAGVGAGVGAGI